MKPKSYLLLTRCIEEGVTYGWSHAHKHTEHPTEDFVKDSIAEAVINEICEWFDFEERGEDV